MQRLKTFYEGSVIGNQDGLEVRQLPGGNQIVTGPTITPEDPYPKLPQGVSIVGETEKIVVVQYPGGTDIMPKLGRR